MFSKIDRNVLGPPRTEDTKNFPFIEMKDGGAESLFLQGKAVFKITSSTSHTKGVRDVFMVTDTDEYFKKFLAHQYSPLLSIVPIYVKLAYLYDCLNRTSGSTRSEQFTFWWRIIGKDEWKIWFIVNPYND
jgi:hypothetical protein